MQCFILPFHTCMLPPVRSGILKCVEYVVVGGGGGDGNLYIDSGLLYLRLSTKLVTFRLIDL